MSTGGPPGTEGAQGAWQHAGQQRRAEVAGAAGVRLRGGPACIPRQVLPPACRPRVSLCQGQEHRWPCPATLSGWACTQQKAGQSCALGVPSACTAWIGVYPWHRRSRGSTGQRPARPGSPACWAPSPGHWSAAGTAAQHASGPCCWAERAQLGCRGCRVSLHAQRSARGEPRCTL